MSRPTQAQIEAAAEAMMRDMFAPHELPLNDELRGKYLHTAEAALTAAAAEAGEMKAWNNGQELECWPKGTIAATIERCAQVAEDILGPEKMPEGFDVPAAIRALRDQP